MAHCSVANSYQTTANAAEDCDTKQGSGYCNEVGSFTCWRKCSRYELDSDTTGKSDTPIPRYQQKEKSTTKKFGVLDVAQTDIPRIIVQTCKNTYCRERQTN